MRYLEIPAGYNWGRFNDKGELIKPHQDKYPVYFYKPDQAATKEAVTDYIKAHPAAVFERCPVEDKQYLEHLPSSKGKPISWVQEVNGIEKKAYRDKTAGISSWHRQTLLSDARRKAVDEHRAEVRTNRRTKGPGSV